MEIAVINRPLAQLRLTILCDTRIGNAGFRAAFADLGAMLIYEAGRELPVDSFDIQTPITTAPGYRLQDPPITVLVIRVGLDTIDSSLSMIPDAQVSFIDLVRNRETHESVSYLEAPPEDLSGHIVFLVDPMLAIGGSLLHALKLLVDRGMNNITTVCIISVQQGVDALKESSLPVRLVTTVVSPDLNEDAYIVPGLGGASDRLYSPHNVDL